ncbi:MAG: ATPase [Gammaproteobacteria bacterium]|nr:ATPase [Gammaproteobacteria bacterium]
MDMTPQQFLDWKTKRITLLGMSGVGKTTLSSKLPADQWFHYSGDYRIGTKYMEEHILDNIKKQAMDVPFLRDLLLTDSIYICSNVTVNNLAPIATFLGKIGNSDLGGLSLDEFKRRQKLHREAEMKAMRDVPSFIHKARDIYGYQHFVNDAGGSICELDDEATIKALAEHTLIVYIKASPKQESMLIERARKDPKPLYYREQFLDEHLALFMKDHGFNHVDQIPPDEFVSWVFPYLFHARIPRYQDIVDQYGYTIESDTILNIANESDLLALIADAIADKTV